MISATRDPRRRGHLRNGRRAQLKAGKTNLIKMPLLARSLKSAPASGKATFKITLRTNGRPTVETRTVTVVVPASVR